MNDIPKYLNTTSEEEFDRWQRFAFFLKHHNSDYLTREDREEMILNLYQVERGYAEDTNILESKEIYRPFLSQVSENLGRLVLIKSRDYNWESFIKNFTSRGSGADFVDIVSHDLMILERARDLYKLLKEKKIKFEEKFSTSFDKTAFKVAKLLVEDAEKNYMP